MAEHKLMMSSSPHITADHSTKTLMRDVLIALAPAMIAGTVFFGLRSLVVVALSVAAALLTEFLFQKIRKKPCTLPDLSAAVTGVILGLNLSPAVPLYIPVLGGVFAIAVVKLLFGGLGRNFANPAAAARVFLLLSFSAAMGTYFLPIQWSNGASGLLSGLGVDAVTGATPLSGGSSDLLSLFLGNVGGCIGETSVVAILIGFLYLLIRRVIDWKIPTVIVVTGAVFSAIFGLNPLIFLMSGGFLFGCVFMATDYATSPNTAWGSVIYAVVIGLITVLLRIFTKMPEGMSFALLLGNLITPLLDKWIIPKPFGYQPPKKEAAGDAKK